MQGGSQRFRQARWAWSGMVPLFRSAAQQAYEKPRLHGPCSGRATLQRSGASAPWGNSSDGTLPGKRPPRGVALQMAGRYIFQRGPSNLIEFPHWNISGDVGLVSAGRINKDTPPLTTPGHTSRSSAMDISSHIFQIGIHGGLDRHFHLPSGPRPV